MLKSFILFSALISISANALPIDWNGSFTTDTFRIDNFKLGNTTTGVGSQAVDPGTSSGTTALIQTYILKLKPHMIINDGLSFKGLFSVGNIQGESFGSNTQFSSDSNSTGGLHYLGTPAGNSELDVSQLYAEIYADTALYRVGRFTHHWGLGAIANEGANADDRFFSLYDGFEAEYNFGKFYVTPYWSKLKNGNTYTRNTAISELGAKFLYDNPDKDMKMGVLYTKRTFGGASGLKALDTDSTSAGHDIGASDMKIFDIFIQKNFSNLEIKAEIPLISGNAGNLYDTSTLSTYKSQAILLDLLYKKSAVRKYGILFGTVSGDDGTTDSFEGMYLHPNFKIAHMLFNYNLNAVGNADKNIFESYITNTTFVKLYTQIVNDSWTWKLAYIYAKANEVAKQGSKFYHHERRYRVSSANASQDDFMGHEFDFSFDYQWNPNVILTGFFGYLLTGDYYSFTNSATKSDTKNAYTSGLKLQMSF